LGDVFLPGLAGFGKTFYLTRHLSTIHETSLYYYYGMNKSVADRDYPDTAFLAKEHGVVAGRTDQA
jgi:hypothetical protein